MLHDAIHCDMTDTGVSDVAYDILFVTAHERERDIAVVFVADRGDGLAHELSSVGIVVVEFCCRLAVVGEFVVEEAVAHLVRIRVVRKV